jgi:hypothetical protein
LTVTRKHLAAIRKLRNNSAPGEALKPRIQLMWRQNAVEEDSFINGRMCKEEQMPKEWHIAIKCPMYKKGKKMECNNY